MAAALWAAAGASASPKVELSIGIRRIEAELANTDASREIGLAGRLNLGASQGMLLVFPQFERHCLWMRGTLIPLSVAFLDGQGRVVDVQEMQAQTDTYHCARRKARYALEMNRGWFSGRGIKPGALVTGIESVPQAE